MGLIVQTSPIIDNAISGLSADYTYQLTASGGIGQLTFAVTLLNPAFEVSETGALITTGVLLDGNYQISGTVADAHGNSGTWVFTLTVVGGIAPGTAVTPVMAALPNPLEILVPFQIDSATGAVAQITDYFTIIKQHVQTILQTAQGERLMNPSFGAGVGNYVFSPITDTELAVLTSDINKQLQAYEPDISIINVSANQDQQNPNQVDVLVSFSVLPFGSVNTVTVSSGGPINQVN